LTTTSARGHIGFGTIEGVPGEEWRVQVGFSSRVSTRRLKEVNAIAGVQCAAHLGGHRIVFYADCDADVQRLLAASEQEGGTLVRLERWVPGDAIWRVVSDDGHSAEGASVPVDSSWGLGPRMVILILALGLAGGVFVYSVPGSAGSPNAGPHHDLGRSITIVVISLVITCGYMLIRFRRRAD
jgi:hypothetical protein